MGEWQNLPTVQDGSNGWFILTSWGSVHHRAETFDHLHARGCAFGQRHRISGPFNCAVFLNLSLTVIGWP